MTVWVIRVVVPFDDPSVDASVEAPPFAVVLPPVGPGPVGACGPPTAVVVVSGSVVEVVDVLGTDVGSQAGADVVGVAGTVAGVVLGVVVLDVVLDVAAGTVSSVVDVLEVEVVDGSVVDVVDELGSVVVGVSNVIGRASPKTPIGGGTLVLVVLVELVEFVLVDGSVMHGSSTGSASVRTNAAGAKGPELELLSLDDVEEVSDPTTLLLA